MDNTAFFEPSRSTTRCEVRADHRGWIPGNRTQLRNDDETTFGARTGRHGPEQSAAEKVVNNYFRARAGFFSTTDPMPGSRGANWARAQSTLSLNLRCGARRRRTLLIGRWRTTSVTVSAGVTVGVVGVGQRTPGWSSGPRAPAATAALRRGRLVASRSGARTGPGPSQLLFGRCCVARLPARSLLLSRCGMDLRKYGRGR